MWRASILFVGLMALVGLCESAPTSGGDPCWITVMSRDGDKRWLRLDSGRDTAAGLKDRIAEVKSFPKEKFVLIYEGNSLKGDRLLSEYGIECDSEIAFLELPFEMEDRDRPMRLVGESSQLQQPQQPQPQQQQQQQQQTPRAGQEAPVVYVEIGTTGKVFYFPLKSQTSVEMLRQAMAVKQDSEPDRIELVQDGIVLRDGHLLAEEWNRSGSNIVSLVREDPPIVQTKADQEQARVELSQDVQDNKQEVIVHVRTSAKEMLGLVIGRGETIGLLRTMIAHRLNVDPSGFKLTRVLGTALGKDYFGFPLADDSKTIDQCGIRDGSTVMVDYTWWSAVKKGSWWPFKRSE